MEDYEVIKPIGKGSFASVNLKLFCIQLYLYSKVFLGKSKKNNQFYVIKKILTRELSEKELQNTLQEVKLLQNLKHPNIVLYKESLVDSKHHLNIIMSYCEGGDLYNLIQQQQQQQTYFSEQCIIDWLTQLALALFYLHDQRILHRDLKTQNIFLKNNRLQLGDFGIAKVLQNTKDLTFTCIGTPYYMSPELIKYKPYSYKSDIWALGCVLYEICNLTFAFEAQNIEALALKIIKGQFNEINPKYSQQLRSLICIIINFFLINQYIEKMLTVNPKQRPSIVDVLNQPLIKNNLEKYYKQLQQNPFKENELYLDVLKEQLQKLNISIVQCFESDMNQLLEKVKQERNIVKQKLITLDQAKQKRIQTASSKIKQERKYSKEEDNVQYEIKVKNQILNRNQSSNALNENQNLIRKNLKILSLMEEQLQKQRRKPKIINNQGFNSIRESFESDIIQMQKKLGNHVKQKSSSEQKKQQNNIQIQHNSSIIKKLNFDNESDNQTKKNESSFQNNKEKVEFMKQIKKQRDQEAFQTEFNIIIQQNVKSRQKAKQMHQEQYHGSKIGNGYLIQTNEQINSDYGMKPKQKLANQKKIDQIDQKISIHEEHDMNWEDPEEIDFTNNLQDEDQSHKDSYIETRIDMTQTNFPSNDNNDQNINNLEKESQNNNEYFLNFKIKRQQKVLLNNNKFQMNILKN